MKIIQYLIFILDLFFFVYSDDSTVCMLTQIAPVNVNKKDKFNI